MTEAFTPLTVDLDTYEEKLRLEDKVRELAEAKVLNIEAVFDEAFHENFDLMLAGLSPVLPGDEESLESMVVRSYHSLKIEQGRADREFIRGIKQVAIHSATWSFSVGLILLLIFRLSITRSLMIGLITAPFASPILAIRYK